MKRRLKKKKKKTKPFEVEVISIIHFKKVNAQKLKKLLSYDNYFLNKICAIPLNNCAIHPAEECV